MNTKTHSHRSRGRIHSAIALNEAEMQKLEALGTPAILVVPNRIHRLDAAVYKQRYPQLAIVCPAAAKPYVEAVVAVDGTAEEVLLAYGIVCHQRAGVYEQELVYELPLSVGKVINLLTVLAQQGDPEAIAALVKSSSESESERVDDAEASSVRIMLDTADADYLITEHGTTEVPKSDPPEANTP